MIPISENLSSLLMLLGVLPSILIIILLWDHRQKPGVIWLIGAAMGFITWGITFTTIFAISDNPISYIATCIFVITPFVTASAWFMFCYEFTAKKPIPKWVYGLFGIAAISFVLALFNPSELMFRANPSDPYALFPSEPDTLRFFLNVILAYTLVLFGTGMVIGEGFRSNRFLRKKQAGIIFLTTIILVSLSLLKVVNVVPTYFDPTPFAVSIGFLFLAYSIRYHNLGREVSIARQQTVELSNDGMIVTGPNDEIIDINRATKQLFGHDIYGKKLNTILDPEQDVITIPDGTIERSFQLKSTDIEYGRGTHATLYILSEITEIKKREEELDMVHTIMQRVFRHNIRNKLTPIMGHSEMIKAKAGEELEESADQILKNAEKLHGTSEKSIEIGNVINNRKTSEKEIGNEVMDAIQSAQNNYPHANITYNIEDTTAPVHTILNRAIEEAIENGIEYNENETPNITIHVRDTPETAQIWIADDGTKIPDMEIQVLEEENETPTKHSNGAGLWLMKWIVERSNGTQKFYTHEEIEGTVTKMEFQKDGL